jgi:hypothetical protein
MTVFSLWPGAVLLRFPDAEVTRWERPPTGQQTTVHEHLGSYCGIDLMSGDFYVPIRLNRFRSSATPIVHGCRATWGSALRTVGESAAASEPDRYCVGRLPGCGRTARLSP